MLLLVHALGQSKPSPDNLLVARSMAEAVESDVENPITDSKENDLALGMTFAFHESAFRSLENGRCIAGDGGKALGPWQLQHVSPGIACIPATAARRWLEMAHESFKRCGSLPVDQRLAALASGNCAHGTMVSADRMRDARRDLMAVLQAAEEMR